MRLFSGRNFVLAITVLGAVALLEAGLQWQTSDRKLFLCLAGFGVAAGWMQEGQVWPRRTPAVQLLLVLLAFCWLTYPEALLIGCLSAFLQALRIPRQRENWVGTAFDTAATAIGIRVAHFSFAFVVGHWGMAPALPATAATLILFLSFPSAAAVTLLGGARLWRSFRQQFLRSLPGAAGGTTVAVLMVVLTGTALWLIGLLGIAAVAMTSFVRARLEARNRLESYRLADGSTPPLGGALDVMAGALAAHTDLDWRQYCRTRFYIERLTEELGLESQDAEAIRVAAMLSQWGKLTIPAHLERKPGTLTPDEMERLRIHATVSAEIGLRAGLDPQACLYVRHHRERWDGTGWPKGICGTDIPLGARVVGIATAIAALRSDRPHRAGLTLKATLEVIAAQRGAAFDPALADLVIAKLEDWERELHALLANEREAVRRKPVQEVTQAKSRALQGCQPDIAQLVAAARREDEAFLAVTELMGSGLPAQELFLSIGRRIYPLIPYEAAALLVQQPDGAYTTLAATGECAASLKGLRVPRGKGLVGQVAARRESVLNGDPAQDGPFAPNEALLKRLGACMMTPLEGALGVMGVAALYRRKAGSFRRDELRLFHALTRSLGLAVEYALKYERACSTAATDSLTGLANAGSLMERLRNEIARGHRSNSSFALLLCDLNEFKRFNDQFGHLEGNNLLRAVSRGFRDCCREYDFIARMGGDEFVLLLPGMGPDSVRGQIERLSRVVVEACRDLCGEDVVTVSVGDAYFPQDGSDANTLLQVADQRMYEAKRLFKLVVQGRPQLTAHDWHREKLLL